MLETHSKPSRRRVEAHHNGAVVVNHQGLNGWCCLPTPSDGHRVFIATLLARSSCSIDPPHLITGTDTVPCEHEVHCHTGHNHVRGRARGIRGFPHRDNRHNRAHGQGHGWVPHVGFATDSIAQHKSAPFVGIREREANDRRRGSYNRIGGNDHTANRDSHDAHASSGIANATHFPASPVYSPECCVSSTESKPVKDKLLLDTNDRNIADSINTGTAGLARAVVL